MTTMPGPETPLRPRPRVRRRRLILRGALVATLVAAALTAVAYMRLRANLPSLATLEENADPVGGTLILSARGDTLASYYKERRVNVELGEVPRHLKLAVLSVEDWRFYEHWGLDLQGMGRATLANLRHGAGVQGASTLSQQLARNLFAQEVTREHTLGRKIREAIVALRIERKYTKDEIFRMYLNQIYFGEGAHGVEAAARTYFGKSARDLDLLEAATLAGLPKNPNNYSPLDHPERAQRRRNIVLRTMLEPRIITRAEFDSLSVLPLLTHPGGDALPAAGYFTEEVRKYLEGTYGAEKLYGAELRVYTTLDPDLQHSAEAALESRYADVEANLNLPHARRNYLNGREKQGAAPPRYLQGAVLALDPHTGRILAMVGGRSFQDSRFNRAVQAKRQPGSCFKPFVYLAGLMDGIGPSAILMDTPLVVDMGRNREPWTPQNYTQTFSGPVSLRTSLAKSLNIPTIKLLQQVGTAPVIQIAHRMGIESRLEAVPSLALGTSEVTLLELVSAYAVLANGGISSRPYFIERIEDRRGRLLERAVSHHEEAVDPQAAYVLTSMLQSVLDAGTAHNARDLYGFTAPAAGKTGTTDDLGDGWFVGYTPDLVLGVWGGFDERRPIGLAGSYIALPPWCDIMREYLATHPPRAFARPAGIQTRTVCVDSGKLATALCPRTQSEIFTERCVPTRSCDLHAVAARHADGPLGMRSTGSRH
jgi:1A family penicillin-binding protein